MISISIGRTILLFLLMFTLAPVLPDSRAQTSSPEAKSRRFIVLDLTGTPYERGVQHGKALREAIHKSVAIWKENLQITFKIDGDTFITKFLAKTNYLLAIKKWTPDLLEEVRGISEGAQIDFNTILVFQLMDEYWVNGPEITAEHCSAMGIAEAADHPTIVAQNMDLENFRDGFQTILHIREVSGLEEFVLSQPGLIAFNGMNNRGVGVNTNTVGQLAHSRDGLPVAFVVRGILQRSTYENVASFLKTVHHASGQNYTIGASGRVGYFEASSHDVVEVAATSSEKFVYHTNHPLANHDYSPEGTREMASPNEADNSHIRYLSLQKRLSTGSGNDIIQLIENTLRSHDSEQNPICREWSEKPDSFSYSSTIMILSGDSHLLASPGPPDRYPYEEFRFSQGIKKTGR